MELAGVHGFSVKIQVAIVALITLRLTCIVALELIVPSD